MGDIFLSWQNQCHITGVKKSYFCHTFHLRPKKVSWWVGGGWKVTLVSVCVHFLKLLDTQTQKWTQSLTIKKSSHKMKKVPILLQILDLFDFNSCQPWLVAMWLSVTDISTEIYFTRIQYCKIKYLIAFFLLGNALTLFSCFINGCNYLCLHSIN